MRITFIVPLLILGSSSCDRAAMAPKRLELVEASTVVFPGSAPLLGIAASDSTRLAAWSASELFLLVGDQEWRSVSLGEVRDPIISVAAAAERLEVASARRLVAFDWEGKHLSSHDLITGIPVGQAVRTEREWVVAIVDPTGVLRVGPPALLEGGDDWIRIHPDTLLEGRLPSYRLGVGAERVFLSEVEAPFRTWSAGSEGAAGHAFVPAVEPDAERAIERWIAMPVVDFGGGTIQTFADLASDRRRLAIRDSIGTLTRTAEITIPLAIVGATADRRHLIGVRNVGVAEVVLYRWGWIDDHEKPGEEP